MPRIQASGRLTFGIARSAESLALKAWRNQVVYMYGERYLDWNKAACKEVICGPGSITGTRRCTYSAFPCPRTAPVSPIWRQASGK
jgi:hypothetical protein